MVRNLFLQQQIHDQFVVKKDPLNIIVPLAKQWVLSLDWETSADTI